MPARNFCDCCDESIAPHEDYGSITVSSPTSWGRNEDKIFQMVCRRCAARILDAIRGLKTVAKV
jgi:hypothetical protein